MQIGTTRSSIQSKLFTNHSPSLPFPSIPAILFFPPIPYPSSPSPFPPCPPSYSSPLSSLIRPLNPARKAPLSTFVASVYYSRIFYILYTQRSAQSRSHTPQYVILVQTNYARSATHACMFSLHCNIRLQFTFITACDN